jgi:hypothetical protein
MNPKSTPSDPQRRLGTNAFEGFIYKMNSKTSPQATNLVSHKSLHHAMGQAKINPKKK